MPPGRTAKPAPPPEGLTYHEDLLAAEEEHQLLEQLDELDFRPVVMRGRTARRSVRHFGLEYSYQRKELLPTDPLPDSMLFLRARCARLMQRAAEDLVQVLVGRYPPGAGIGWHYDAPIFGSAIAGVSLLSSCRMRFRRTLEGERRVSETRLEPRSAYLMSEEARWEWQHSIPPTRALRYSITFRTLGA